MIDGVKLHHHNQRSILSDGVQTEGRKLACDSLITCLNILRPYFETSPFCEKASLTENGHSFATYSRPWASEWMLPICTDKQCCQTFTSRMINFKPLKSTQNQQYTFEVTRVSIVLSILVHITALLVSHYKHFNTSSAQSWRYKALPETSSEEGADRHHRRHISGRIGNDVNRHDSGSTSR